jgi:hypothetical protein
MRANGNLLLIAADTAGLLTYSVSNPMVPALLSQFQPSSAVDGVTVDGNLALLAAADGGFVIADMTNPAAPVLASRVSGILSRRVGQSSGAEAIQSIPPEIQVPCSSYPKQSGEPRQWTEAFSSTSITARCSA